MPRAQSQSQALTPRSQSQSEPLMSQSQSEPLMSQSQSEPLMSQSLSEPLMPQSRSQSRPLMPRSRSQSQSEPLVPRSRSRSQSEPLVPRSRSQSQSEPLVPRSRSQSQSEPLVPRSRSQSQSEPLVPRSRSQSQSEPLMPRSRSQSQSEPLMPRSRSQSQSEPLMPRSRSQSQSEPLMPRSRSQSQSEPLMPRSRSQSQSEPLMPRSRSQSEPLMPRSRSQSEPLMPRSRSRSQSEPLMPRSRSQSELLMPRSRSQSQSEPLMPRSLSQSQSQPLVPRSRSQSEPLVPRSRSQSEPLVPRSRSQSEPLVPRSRSQSEPLVPRSRSQSQSEPLVPRSRSQSQSEPLVPRSRSQSQSQPLVPKSRSQSLPQLPRIQHRSQVQRSQHSPELQQQPRSLVQPQALPMQLLSQSQLQMPRSQQVGKPQSNPQVSSSGGQLQTPRSKYQNQIQSPFQQTPWSQQLPKLHSQKGIYQGEVPLFPHRPQGPVPPFPPKGKAQANVPKCEEDRSPSSVLFPAGRFEAYEAYVFESSTRPNGMAGLLGLPTPYLPGSDDLYPDSGKLQEDTYRRPWTREQVMSTSKLSLGSPPFEDLEERKQPVVSPERFIAMDEMEMIPSSNPDSLVDSDLDEYLFEISRTSEPWQESFSKWTSENNGEDLFLPEEVLTVDYLLQFRRHLPTLKAKLSRLSVLLVADPLLGSTGDSISEDAVFSCFQRCELYEKPPHVDSTDVETCAHIHEEFHKESLVNKESLLLPDILETVQVNPENCFSPSRVSDHINVSPEVLNESCPVLLELRQACFPNASVEWISPYRTAGEASEVCKVKKDPADLAERLVLLPEMELDVTFSPTSKKNRHHVCMSTSELQKEELPPFSPLSLVSARTQEEMQTALWKAEKHPNFMVCILLAEPEICEPAVDIQPLCEVSKAFQLKKHSITHTGDHQTETGVLQKDLGCARLLMESMRSESNPGREERVEVFRKVCLAHVEDKTHLQREWNSSHVNTFNTNKEVTPAAAAASSISQETFPVAALRSSTPAPVTSRGGDDGRRERSSRLSVPARSIRTDVSDNARGTPFSRRPAETDHDPLSTFMTLRFQPVVSVPATRQSSASAAAGVGPVEQTPPSEDTPGHMHTIVSGRATREQNPPQWTSKVLGRPAVQSDPQKRPDSTVVQVEATDSQRRAYRELLEFALPCLSSARQLGLNVLLWGDFSRLAPDQTHFLLKQQERALHRTPAPSADDTVLLADQELLLKQATLIHVLVTFKELLLKCDLGTAVEYLSRAVKACAEESVQQLLKRLQTILYLSQMNQEPNFKLQELQRLLAERLHSSNAGHSITGRILVIISADSEDSSSTVVASLKQATGAAVAAVHPTADMKKLNGASVVSSVQACMCVVVCEQHIGPDFPWSCFSLLVEFDHPGHSPWAAVCRERSIGHLTFNTNVSNTEDQDTSWRLQDNVPYVLLVTEQLLNCPMLLHSLESDFNITVLERSYSPTLQNLGGTQNYTVITVDENTAIVIQEQEELCREQVSESLVMRLIALSLQYSCCWFLLHCSGGQGRGFSSEASTNLALLYSSLVVFNMKSEFDLDVKVLIVSDMLDLAKWISQICFTCLMCSDRDALSFLGRDWLTVVPSQDEVRLCQFPSINPLVAQLMLSRAPSLRWLLVAPLPQLKELLPEVSHKVLKLFTDLTARYPPPADPIQSESSPELSLWSQTSEHPGPWQADRLWTDGPGSLLFGARDTQGGFSKPDSAERDGGSDFTVDFLSCSFGSWTSGDPWSQKEEEKLPVWTSRAGAAGGVAERLNDEHTHSLQNPGSPFMLEPTLSCSPALQPPESSHTATFPVVYSDLQLRPVTGGLGLPSNLTWDRGESYGSRRWAGRERKRSGEEAGLFGSVLTPLKRRGLSYEKIPGRSDGQTRLRLL
ncbi:protein shortage in chiasmata 1 ortholog [Salarias fasciatus]|uniref:protein shortage in chiasmata 1 ortholog n=1 Tax=Salarias fasciatus TaxID=181472 RepID=UPI001176C719|nr:protein shortage in chiasmata 1 ortholog [Salarias fasciatus]